MSTLSAASSALALDTCWKKQPKDRRPSRSLVAILRAEWYGAGLERLLFDAIQLFRLDVKGKRVLLKPNLVESNKTHTVNTHPALIVATAIAFQRLGAQSVVIGEGPGTERDTRLVLEESGTGVLLREANLDFVDLNRAPLVARPVGAHYTGIRTLHLPKMLFETDFLVSMPKVKTHHWAGVTLSLKNLFGVVPGVAYGWPKNLLHWHGVSNSIVDLAATVPIHFVVADGITAMEGNGPLLGTSRELHRIILADDGVAADATIAQMMGFDPAKIPYLRECGRFLGNLETARIHQLGEVLRQPQQAFAPPPGWASLI